MGKMKQLFMDINYPMGDLDLEREYLIDDLIAQERSYQEYLTLKASEEMKYQPLNCKIEIQNETNTRIEVHQEKREPDYSSTEEQLGF